MSPPFLYIVAIILFLFFQWNIYVKFYETLHPTFSLQLFSNKSIYHFSYLLISLVELKTLKFLI